MEDEYKLQKLFEKPETAKIIDYFLDQYDEKRTHYDIPTIVDRTKISKRNVNQVVKILTDIGFLDKEHSTYTFQKRSNIVLLMKLLRKDIFRTLDDKIKEK